MEILLTKNLTTAFEKIPPNKVRSFLEAIKRIKDLNKTQIIALDKTIKLLRAKNTDVYAYELAYPFYVLFFFKSKKTLILIDVVELGKDKSLKFLVSGKQIPDEQSLKAGTVM